MDSRFVHSSRFRAALILQICDASSKGQFRRSSEKSTLAGGVHTSRFFAGSRRKRARVARIRPQPPVSCRLRTGGRRPSPPRHLARMTAKRSVAAHLGRSIRKMSSRTHDSETKPRVAGSPLADTLGAFRTACGQSSDMGLFCPSCRQNVLDSHPTSANAERERTRCSTGATRTQAQAWGVELGMARLASMPMLSGPRFTASQPFRTHRCAHLDAS